MHVSVSSHSLSVMVRLGEGAGTRFATFIQDIQHQLPHQQAKTVSKASATTERIDLPLIDLAQAIRSKNCYPPYQ
jgi:hypothetical protein